MVLSKLINGSVFKMENCVFKKIGSENLFILESDTVINAVSGEAFALYNRKGKQFIMSACEFHRSFAPFVSGRKNGD